MKIVQIDFSSHVDLLTQEKKMWREAISFIIQSDTFLKKKTTTNRLAFILNFFLKCFQGSTNYLFDYISHSHRTLITMQAL